MRKPCVISGEHTLRHAIATVCSGQSAWQSHGQVEHPKRCFTSVQALFSLDIGLNTQCKEQLSLWN